jgi:hypothetical protein
MILNLLFSQEINLSDSDDYHPFLKAVDLIMTKTWMGKWILIGANENLCWALC